LEDTDVMYDVLFVVEWRSLELTWRGSANQRIIDVPASLLTGSVIEFEA
jgi:hypothetical protein